MQISLSDHFTFKRLIRFVMPSVIMMIVTSLYSIVDGIFVSNIVGKNAFAAVNLVMPVLMALGSIGFLVGTGGSAIVAKTLGEGKKQKANEYFSMLIKTVIIVGVFLSVIGFIFMPQIAKALGASKIIFNDCVTYGRILLCANTFFMLQNSFQSFLVVAEKPLFGLFISICAGVCNMLLDFLFMYVFDFGIAGAAFATAISQVIGGVIPLIFFIRKNKSQIQLINAKIDFRVLKKACANGSSEMVTNLSMSLASMLYNMQLMKLANENGIAAYGVIMYVAFIFAAIYIGYSIGSSPITSYNYGSGNHAELKNVFRKSLIIITIVSICMLASSQLAATTLAGIFVSYDKELFDLTVNGFKLYSLSFLFSGFNIFSSAFFTALNNGLISAVISFLRTLVFQVSAVFILPLLIGVNGIWLAVVAAEILTLIFSVIFLITNRKKHHY